MQKIEKNPTNEQRKYPFFIPVFEKISDYTSARTWSLAIQTNVARKFYRSTELLKQFESSRLAENQVLSCYKVHLTAAEYSQLRRIHDTADSFVGFLTFKAENIESLVVLDKQNHQEHTNPYHVEERAENDTVYAA